MTEETIEVRQMEVDYTDTKVRYISVPMPNFMYKVIEGILTELPIDPVTNLPPTINAYSRNMLMQITDMALDSLNIQLVDPKLEEYEQSIRDSDERFKKEEEKS